MEWTESEISLKFQAQSFHWSLQTLPVFPTRFSGGEFPAKAEI
jgi:hypothetical protein